LANIAGGAHGSACTSAVASAWGYSQHSGVVIVCDGSEAADKRIARVTIRAPA
jgi:urocanate hydratase